MKEDRSVDTGQDPNPKAKRGVSDGQGGRGPKSAGGAVEYVLEKGPSTVEEAANASGIEPGTAGKQLARSFTKGRLMRAVTVEGKGKLAYLYYTEEQEPKLKAFNKTAYVPINEVDSVKLRAVESVLLSRGGHEFTLKLVAGMTGYTEQELDRPFHQAVVNLGFVTMDGERFTKPFSGKAFQ